MTSVIVSFTYPIMTNLDQEMDAHVAAEQRLVQRIDVLEKRLAEIETRSEAGSGGKMPGEVGK